jgi:ribose transport system substrate-binding protein
MSTRRHFLFVALAALSAVASCKSNASSGSDGGSTGGAPLRIAVIPKGTTHEFWKSVHAGAVKASREAGVEIVWKGPLREDDLKAQIDVVQSFTAQGVSGIVLAPLSDHALASPVKAAQASKIPVVVFDSDLSGVEPVSFVATDNYAAGKMAADEMARILGEKGNVVVLRYQEGSASTANREKGFLDGIKAHAGITVVSDNQYGGATTETAQSTSESLLIAQKAAAGNVNGIFTPNESTTFGMLLALRKADLSKKIRFIGFDSSDKLVGALENAELDALVLQDPFNIGYLAVKTMAASLKGQPVEKRIDTGAKLLTRENAGSPEMKDLLKPDLKKWLGE